MSEFYHDVPKQSTKICPDCSIEKPLTEFYRGCPRCKPCEQLHRKERAQERMKEFENLSPDTTKICVKCHTEKSLDDFYKQPAGIFGRTGKCKICTLEDAGYTNHMQKVPLPQSGGKVCHQCHQEKSKDDFNKESKRRDGLSLICKECSRDYHNEYEYKTGRRKKPVPLPPAIDGGRVCTKCLIEKPLNEFQNQTRIKDGLSTVCKECLNKRGREKYILLYKESILEKNRRWYANNKERHYGLTRRWTITHRAQSNEVSHRYRSRKMSAKIGEVDFLHILERDNCWCYICNGDILPEHKIDFDHVIPLSRGGSHTEDNIKVTHHRCNRRKHNKLLEEMTPFQRRGV